MLRLYFKYNLFLLNSEDPFIDFNQQMWYNLVNNVENLDISRVSYEC